MHLKGFLSFFTDKCARSSTMAQNYAAVWWKTEGVHLFSAVFLRLHYLFFSLILKWWWWWWRSRSIEGFVVELQGFKTHVFNV